jgi:hypothetical protein
MRSHEDNRQTLANTLTPEAFAMMGTPQLAYIGPVSTEQGKGFGIHAANGNLLAVVASRELAFAAARQHELEPVSVQ